MKAFLSPNQKALGRMWPFFTQPWGGRLDERFVFSIDWKNNIVSSSSEPQAFAFFQKIFSLAFHTAVKARPTFRLFRLSRFSFSANRNTLTKLTLPLFESSPQALPHKREPLASCAKFHVWAGGFTWDFSLSNVATNFELWAKPPAETDVFSSNTRPAYRKKQKIWVWLFFFKVIYLC